MRSGPGRARVGGLRGSWRGCWSGSAASSRRPATVVTRTRRARLRLNGETLEALMPGPDARRGRPTAGTRRTAGTTGGRRGDRRRASRGARAGWSAAIRSPAPGRLACWCRTCWSAAVRRRRPVWRAGLPGTRRRPRRDRLAALLPTAAGRRAGPVLARARWSSRSANGRLDRRTGAAGAGAAGGGGGRARRRRRAAPDRVVRRCGVVAASPDPSCLGMLVHWRCRAEIVGAG